MVLITIDLTDEINKEVAIYAIKNEQPSKSTAITEILTEYFKTK